MQAAKDFKKIHFGDYAEDAMKFYAGDHDFMYQQGYMTNSRGLYGECPDPRLKVTVNKVFELVTIYLTYLVHRNPNRVVSAKLPELPEEFLALVQEMQMAQMAQQMGGMPIDPMTGGPPQPPPNPYDNPLQKAIAKVKAYLMQWVLNQTPYEFDLKGNGRRSLVEGLMKGRGVLWTEIIEQGGRRVPSSQYDSVDYVLIDPDHDLVKDSAWIARERCEYVHLVEDRFRLERGSLEGNKESAATKLHYDNRKDSSRKIGQTADMITYYEIYSRVGMGGRLSGPYSPLAEELEQYGKNCYLVVADCCDYPLNIGPDSDAMLDVEYVTEQTRWPIPVHDDHTWPWPVAFCDFAEQPGCVWPVAWIRPALGLQKLLGWMYSFMASHISVASRNFLVVPDDITEEQLDTILHGEHFEVLKVKRMVGAEQWDKLMSYVQHGALLSDWWNVLVKMEEAFKQSTGLTELIYGMQGPTQMRSAQEAEMRQESTMMRPDDMASQVEDFMGLAARNEAVAWRALTEARDAAPLFGERYTDEAMDPATGMVSPPQMGPYTRLWTTLLLTSDIDAILSEFDYRIEAGSVRKPNKAKQRQDIDESAQVVFPALAQDYMKWGDARPINAWLRQWALSRDLEPTAFMLPDRQQQMQQMMMAQQQAQQPPGQGPPEGERATIPMGA